jgi:hypothetical protein
MLALSTFVCLRTVSFHWREVVERPYPPTEVEALSKAIISQESRANYKAINPDSGALGYAQIMPENLPDWSYAALGYEVSPEKFLDDPQLQRQIIEHRLELYWQEALMVSGGDREQAVLRVASHWYSGDPSLYTSSHSQLYNGTEYPSIAEYSQEILKKWQWQQQPWRLF